MFDLKDQPKFMPILVVVLGLIIIIMSVLFFVLEPKAKETINEVGVSNTQPTP